MAIRTRNLIVSYITLNISVIIMHYYVPFSKIRISFQEKYSTGL